MKEVLYAVLVLGAMGALFGAILAIASKVFAGKKVVHPLQLDGLSQ